MNSGGRIPTGSRSFTCRRISCTVRIILTACSRDTEGWARRSLGFYGCCPPKSRALEYHAQALPLRRQVGDRWGERITRFNLARVHAALGDLDEAEAQLGEVVALDEALGHPDLAADRAALARIQAQRGATPPQDPS